MKNFKHITPIQIRFKDTDMMGHVNNANHLTYIELARLKYFDDVLQGARNWKNGPGLILARIEIDYRKPILIRDNISVGTRCSKIGTKSVQLDWEIENDNNAKTEPVAQGIAVVVYFDYEKNQTIPIPEEHRKLLTAFEGL